MKRTLKIALGAAFTSVLFAPTFAQENFPDAPEYHWAYQQLLNMKNEGILVGYPDGLFRGGRPASRYEMAVAINAAYERLKQMIGDMSNQITAINQKIEDLDDKYASKADLTALRDQLASLQSDMQKMRGWGDDIENLKKMADMFQKDLAELGVDVEAMKKDLSDLASRVEALEKRKPAVDIHGDVNFIGIGAHSTDGLFGLSVDARILGFNSAFGGPAGITRDLQMGHELALQFSGTNDTGPKWHATIVAGNLIGLSSDGSSSFFGDQASTQFGVPFDEVDESVYIQDLGVVYNTSIGGQEFEAEIGRIGFKTGKYFFYRPDNTPYFENWRWDDHNWYFDGGRVSFDWGAVDLDVWTGKVGRSDIDGTTIWPIFPGGQFNFGSNIGFPVGNVVVDTTLGFNLGIDIGERGDIMLNYIFLDWAAPGLDPKGASADRITVWGGEVNFNITDNIVLNGGYSRSDWMDNTSTTLDEKNFAWWAQVGWQAERWGLYAGWRRIEPYFSAPGDWGRMAIYWNPMDNQGFYGGLNFNLSENVKANLSGYFFTGLRDSTDPDSVLFDDDDDITGIMGDIEFKIGESWNAMLGAEFVKFDFATGTEDEFMWWRVGFRWTPEKDHFVKFFYEFSDVDFGGSSTDFKGGLATVQWSKKI